MAVRRERRTLRRASPSPSRTPPDPRTCAGGCATWVPRWIPGARTPPRGSRPTLPIRHPTPLRPRRPRRRRATMRRSSTANQAPRRLASRCGNRWTPGSSATQPASRISSASSWRLGENAAPEAIPSPRSSVSQRRPFIRRRAPCRTARRRRPPCSRVRCRRPPPHAPRGHAAISRRPGRPRSARRTLLRTRTPSVLP